MDSVLKMDSVKGEGMENLSEQQITFEIPENLNFDQLSGYNQNLSEYFHSDRFANVASVDLNSATNNNNNNNVGNVLDTLEYQHVLNYLWIAIVTSLIIVSIIFVIFSCYFYRKFREWKKCNKDIRLQIPNDLYHAGSNGEDGYYQVESPPCYTIATGLPTYDEALLQAHFTFGMKVLHPWAYPSRNNNYKWEDNSTVVKEIENCISVIDDENCTDNDSITITKGTDNRNIDCPEIVVIS